ncbi:hypothetical protein Tco_0666597 [Tanacetum coccineum]
MIVNGTTANVEYRFHLFEPLRQDNNVFSTLKVQGLAFHEIGVRVSHVGESVCEGFVFKIINGKIVRSRGRGDGSKSSAYPHGIKPIGFGVSWDPINGEPMLGVYQNIQGIPVPAWPYEGTSADLLTQDQADEIPNTSSQPMPDMAEPEQAEPKQAKPEQVEPEQAEPEQAEPEEVEH